MAGVFQSMTPHDPTPPALKHCFYSLVRYVPDLAKGEVMNIGILLHCPQDEYLGCLFTTDMRRIRHFHPNADLALLRALQQDFEQQIDRHEAQLDVYLETLRQTLSNLIQLAPASVRMAPVACAGSSSGDRRPTTAVSAAGWRRRMRSRV